MEDKPAKDISGLSPGKEERNFLCILEEIVGESENKYQTVMKIANEIKRRIELGSEGDTSLIIKVIEEFKKKDEKNSTGSNR